MTETQRAAMQQALEALASCSGVPHWPALQPTITALRAALAEPQTVNEAYEACELLKRMGFKWYELEESWYPSAPAKPEPEPVADPFADIRGKRMGELNDEQADRARERWLRDQIDPRESYWYPHLQALFRIIDRLRAAPAEPEPVAGYRSCPTHCCPVHGCKYGHLGCPVHLGQVKPEYPHNNGCEYCESKPEPEPVTLKWIDWWRDHGQHNLRATSQMTFDRATALMKLAFEVGREAAPPARRPLTDEEIGYLWRAVCDKKTRCTTGELVRAFARAIERKITGGNDE